ncbi:hypothetical protein U2F10_02890 [Leptothoe sp. EHU-05/26/07-4]
MTTLTLTVCDRFTLPPAQPSKQSLPPSPSPAQPSSTLPHSPAHPFRSRTRRPDRIYPVHPYEYATSATPSNLPPRLHIVRQSLGYRAYFDPLLQADPTSTDATNTDQQPSSTYYSDYHPTAELALAAHLPEYIEDLVAYDAFQTLLALSQKYDGQAVIDAFERLKQVNPDEDYYLDAELGKVPPISEL